MFLFTKERKGDNLSFFYADDHTRVLLNPIDGVAGSDYINASFIDVSFHYFFVSYTSLRAFYNKVVWGKSCQVMAGLQFGINTSRSSGWPPNNAEPFSRLASRVKNKQNKTRNADYCGEVLEIDILSTGEVISYFVCG